MKSKLKKVDYKAGFTPTPNFSSPGVNRLRQRGFTIIELLIVLAIMGIFLTLILANYAGTRGKRDLKIAQVELVTNIRKTQSYVLAARNTNVGAVKYYFLRFQESQPSLYQIWAIQNDTTTVTLVETINLPQGVTVSDIEYTQPIGSSAETPTCVEIAFALPFNKMYADPECTTDLLAQGSIDPDNYVNAYVILSLTENQTNTTKKVTINGVTGVVEAQ